ncbi:MAG TPA: LysE family translocator [Methylomirabilota bacterium]|nr:LysE family translocator [Methylomirabilota bacterium]
MDPVLFARGVAIGFSIAAPVGPIGVLCIRRTLADGRAAGFVSGLGAAAADAVYGGIAGFGLTALASLLLSHQGAFRLVGGAFLCYLGVRTFRSRPASGATSLSGAGLTRGFGSTFLLTLTNPLTILLFAAVFAGLGAVGSHGGPSAAATLVAGVFAGSALWWLTLSVTVGAMRSRLNLAALGWVNRLAGLVILGFGVAALLSGLPSPPFRRGSG